MFRRAFHDRVFILSSFPIALLAFCLVTFTLSGGGFLPFMVILLLAGLTFAESFASFEIRRTNRILKTEIIAPTRPWYSHPFWSWDGVTERLGTSKAWFVIAYVYVAIFFSSIGVAIMVLSWVAIAVLIFALGFITPSNWSWVFQINDNDLSGKFSFMLDPEKFRITFSGFQSTQLSIPDQLTWVYTSGWTVAICFFFLFLNFFMIPAIARQMKDIVASLLGANSMADDFTATVKRWIDARKKK